MPAIGLLISRDLFFASKVTGTAQALGLSVRTIGSPDQLQTAKEEELTLVILDLDCPGVTPAEVMAALPSGKTISTIAFGPHVHEDRLAAARSAGFEQVLPRSKFSAGLVDLLKAAFHGE